MHDRMDRPLHDWYNLRYRFRCMGRQQLASASDAAPSNTLRDCHGLDAILHHAARIWAGIGCIKNIKSYAGKASQFDESYCVWHWSLSVRTVDQLVARDICLTKRISMLKLDVKWEWATSQTSHQLYQEDTYAAYSQ